MRSPEATATVTMTDDAGDMRALRWLLRDPTVRMAACAMMLLAIIAVALPRALPVTDPPSAFASISRLLDAWLLTVATAALASVAAWLTGCAAAIVAALAGPVPRSALRWATHATASVPMLLLAFACLAVTGVGAPAVALAVAASQCPWYVERALALIERERERPYVEAARGFAIPARTIYFRHVLPNLASALAMLPLAGPWRSAMAAYATLAFLGLASASDASLGALLASESRTVVGIAAAFALCATTCVLHVIAMRARVVIRTASAG